MFKLFFLFFAFVIFIPFFLLFLLFAFPPTRKLFAYLLNKKFQKMTKNGHVYYRSYHYQNGRTQTYSDNKIRDVTPKSDDLIDVTPISDSNLRKPSNNETTAN